MMLIPLNKRTLGSIIEPNRPWVTGLASVVWLLLLPAVGSAIESGQFVVRPGAAGRQLVRASIPLPSDQASLTTLREAARQGRSCQVTLSGPSPTTAALRVLSWQATEDEPYHVPRRGMISFEYNFPDRSPITFTLGAVDGATSSTAAQANEPWPVRWSWVNDRLQIQYATGEQLACEFLGPAPTKEIVRQEEVIEDNAHFQWKRYFIADTHWPRWVEVRADRLGTIALIVHVQRVAAEDDFAPDLGWQVVGSWGDEVSIYHPLAAGHQRAQILEASHPNHRKYEYWRCKSADRVPMQLYAWQRVEMVIAPRGQARLPASLTYPHQVTCSDKDLARLYPHWRIRKATPDELYPLLQYHRDALCASVAVGNDFGNVTGFNHGAIHGGIFGMNRLNHNAPIFEEVWHRSNECLRETALGWCDNFYDQSIWWGPAKHGGTRYNNVAAQNKQPPTTDYMWRSNDSVHFCTKGYDSFWLAYEETGDPRMMHAMQAQVAYASEHIHADQGECRNVGDVRDFVRLYRMTGNRQYLAQALRLFRELRTKLSPEFLFDQGGKPLAAAPPFIDDDQKGLTVGYAKPYIIGYGLAGLPELYALTPEEPQLRETIRGVAEFLASTVDPAGGWRYPHPRSSLTLASFGPEHAWHLTQACRALGPEPNWLDAIETVLRARIHSYRQRSTILSSVEGWEITSGKVNSRLELQDLYQSPAERDFQRDWSEGRVSLGSSPPEGLVYFADVLDYYLQHRPLSRLTQLDPEEPLAKILNRAPKP